MSSLLEKRKFKLWSYHRSMSTLLLRGFLEEESDKGIVDILFYDVVYLEMADYLGEIEIEEGTNNDCEYLEKILGKKVSRSAIWIIKCQNSRFIVLATSISIKEFFGQGYQLPWELRKD